jgi:hypothetical protein
LTRLSDILERISANPYKTMSTPKPYGKSDGERLAGEFYLQLKKLDCIRGIGSGILEIIGTDYVLMVRGTKSTAELFFANRVYIKQARKQSHEESVSLDAAFRLSKVNDEFDEFLAIPHFLDAMEEMPEELQGYIVTNIPDFADYDVSDRVRKNSEWLKNV